MPIIGNGQIPQISGDPANLAKPPQGSVTVVAISNQLDDGWPESVEEQSLLLLVWRHDITILQDNILKMYYRQTRRVVSKQYIKRKTIVFIVSFV